MRRLFIIIAAVIVLIGIAVGVYFIFFSGNGASLTVGNPFGNIGSGTAQPGGGLPNSDQSVSGAGTQIAPRFIKVTDGPISTGEAAFDVQIPVTGSATAVVTTVSATTTSTSTITSSTSTSATVAQTTPDVEIRFIDRASGNVYSYLAHARTLTRISNKTLPGIQGASWTSDGSRAYAQFLSSDSGGDHIDTYALNADGSNGYLLEQDLDEARVAGSSTLFTLLTGTTGSVGSLARADGSNAKTLFSSLISSLVVSPTTGDLFATNKPSSQIDGYGFQISRSSGAFTRILGPARGLSILPSPNGSSLIYSYTDGTNYNLAEYDVATRSITALPVATLAEKCVWAANGKSAYCAVPTAIGANEPDLWYQGATAFTDRIWKIDLTARVATLVLDPANPGGGSSGVSIDAIGLTVDSGERELVFTDKHTGALYVYDL